MREQDGLISITISLNNWLGMLKHYECIKDDFLSKVKSRDKVSIRIEKTKGKIEFSMISHKVNMRGECEQRLDKNLERRH